MKVIHHAATDVGRKRRDNEDSFLADPERGLFVVADGMGGHAAGEVASRMTVEVLGTTVRERWAPGAVAPAGADPDKTGPLTAELRLPGPDVLRMAIASANEKVLEVARERRECRGMAATVVAVLLDGDLAHVAHAGDSRAYRLRGGGLQLLTSDHSWVGEQIQKGALTAEEARTHPLRNMVTRAVGGRKELEPAVDAARVAPGDVLLLCSDGLTSMVPDADIARVLLEADTPEAAVARLVDAANERGGQDNITVVVARLEEGAA